MKMQKTLITGATGGLGSAVANFLAQKTGSQQIAVLVRDASSDKAKALAARGFELRVADYADKAALEKAFEGIGLLYFVSGSDLGERWGQHQNVVNAAVAAEVGHIVYTSVAVDHLSEDAPLYGAMSSHFQTENLIKASNLAYTLLRHNLYAEVIPMFLGSREQLMTSKHVFLPAGEGKTAFVPRVELAEAAANILADIGPHVNKIYELNGSEGVTFGQVAGYLSDITKTPFQYTSPDVKTFEETLKGFGVPAEYIGMMTVFGVAIADGVFDTGATDLEKILGRKTQPVDEFLSDIYA